MGKKRALSAEQADELFCYIRSGHSYKDAGKKWGVTQQTAGKYYREVLHRRSREAQANGGVRVVADVGGDRLTFDVERGYVGETSVGGVSETRTFDAGDDKVAAEMFAEWLEEMEGERVALDEMLKPAPAPDVNVERWRDKAERLESEVAELGERLSQAEAIRAELERRVEELESKPQVEVEGLPETIYVVVAERPCVKGYGYYVDMDTACAEVEHLNEVARLLGSDGAFDVHEIALRGREG